MIRIERLTKCFKTKDGVVRALSDVDLVLPNTGFVALCGENGCGKTTLLNVISTIMLDYEGKVYIDDLEAVENRDYIKAKLVSYVLQDEYFIDSVNVEDTLFLENGDREINKSELEEFKISDKALKGTNELSGGQRQKVSFIRGTLKECSILLVDEPTSSMDEEMEDFVFKKLKELSREKLVILVSHNMSKVYEYSDIIIRLNNGKIASISENSSVSEITYRENEITFLGDLNFKAIDNDIASEMMDSFEKVVVKREKRPKKSFEADYEPREHNETKLLKKMNPQQEKIIFKSMLQNSRKTIISLAVLLGIFLVLLEAMLDLKTFDEDSFIFNSMVNNGEKLVSTYHYDFAGKYDPFGEPYEMTYSEAVELQKRFGVRMDIVTVPYYHPEIVSALDDFYFGMISGKSESFLSEKDMLAGKIPDAFEFALTDYLADVLIKYDDSYSSYDDIIEKGVFVDNYNLDICGIVDTDYEIYRDKTSYTHQDIVNLMALENKLYGNVFTSPSKEPVSKIRYAHISSMESDCFTDIYMKNDLPGEYMAVNKALAEDLKYSGKDVYWGKSDGFELYIDAIIDDGNENPSLYMNEYDFNYLVNRQNKYFSHLNIEIVDREMISYLSERYVRIDSYTGYYIYDIIEVIDILEKFFFVLIAVIGISLLILTRSKLKNVSLKNARAFAFTKLSGFQEKNFFALEMKAVLISLGFVLLVNALSYFIIYQLTNALLSKICECAVPLMMNSFKTFALIALCLAFLFVLLETINYFSRRRKQVIDLL